MANTERGVSYYTKTTVSIYFPECEPECRYCPLLETYSRYQCRRTGEYIADTRSTGRLCPLEKINDNEQRRKEND